MSIYKLLLLDIFCTIDIIPSSRKIGKKNIFCIFGERLRPLGQTFIYLDSIHHGRVESFESSNIRVPWSTKFNIGKISTFLLFSKSTGPTQMERTPFRWKNQSFVINLRNLLLQNKLIEVGRKFVGFSFCKWIKKNDVFKKLVYQ